MLKTYEDTGLIKVLDPRHPLFGGEFRLLRTIKSKNGQTIFVIEVKPGIRRSIPIKVTDRGDPFNVHTIPIDVESLVNFCDTYRREEDDVKTSVADESIDQTE